MLLTERKMEVLEKLERSEKSPTELSKEMDLTISSVNKHLSELEEMGLVFKSGKKKGKTRSYWKYKLKDFMYLVSSLDGRVKRKRLSLDERHKVHLRVWSVPQTKFHKYLDKFWCEVQEELEKIDGLMVYGSVARGDARKDSDIDILMISSDKDLEDKYEAKVVGKKMFMAKVFSRVELEESLEKGSSFALNTIKEGITIYDPDGFLREMEYEYKE